jgi:cytochrome c oxidase subunit III
MKNTQVLDVSELPTCAFGAGSLMWWGTLGMIAIEGTVFALALAAYYYLAARSQQWPLNLAPPWLTFGTVNLVLMLFSLVPNEWAQKASEKKDLRYTRLAMIACILFGVAFVVVRVFEFRHLNCNWDTNAYGSAVWTILGFHTAHIVTDLIDTIVLTVLLFTSRMEERHFVDVSENAFYWYFVVLAWIPIYATVYLAPRWMR